MIDRLDDALSDRYDILREVGAGGMATVYIARDRRHDRQVAIKVLRPELAAVVGAERFLAEIKTTANLQHPHILPLFDSGEADGFVYYVMPYVDGDSLREVLDREKQLPVADAVEIAGKVASALHHAHDKGIVHRDIKPANILMAGDEPLVADFGIALAVQHAGAGRLTETGLSMGTPYYMSPEQATGDREPDGRSDVYALACVLYEMLTGEPPFPGKTAQAVLARILTERPKPAGQIRPSIPAHVDRALDRALEKLPADRFADAEEFARALGDPSLTAGTARGVGDAAGAAGARGRGLGGWVWPAVAAVLAALALLGWWDRPAADEGVVVHRLGYPELLAPTDAARPSLALSPDGERLVMSAPDSLGGWRVYVKEAGALDATLVTRSQQPPVFAVSPDGRDLALLEGSTLSRVSLSGGSRLVLSDSAQLPVRWPTGGYIYFTRLNANAPTRISENGGRLETISLQDLGDEVFLMSDVLPDGTALLGMMGPGSLLGMAPAVADPESGSVEKIGGPGFWPQYAASGHILWEDGSGTVYAAPWDPGSLRPAADPIPVAQNVMFTQGGFADYAVNGSGTMAFRRTRADVGSEIVEVRRTGEVRIREQTLPVGGSGRISPDGRRLAYEAPQGQAWDVHVLDLTTGTRARLTFDGVARYPTWNRAGDSVAYYRYGGERGYDLWIEPASGAGEETRVLETPNREVEVAFTDDPDRVVVRQGDRSRADVSELWLYSRSNPEDGRPVADGPYSVRSPVVSPDGRWVAYVSDETGADEIFVRSLENPEVKAAVSNRGGVEPHWAWSGEELFYREGSRLVSVPVRLRPDFAITGERRQLFDVGGYYSNFNHTSYGVMPDDQTFLFFRQTTDEGVFLVENWPRLLSGG